MENNMSHLPENCLLTLFESAVRFDRDAVIDLIRKSPKTLGGKATQDLMKRFFRGYSRAFMMPDSDVEKLFRKMCSTKRHRDWARRIIDASFFSFFVPSIIRFKVIFFSTLNLSVEDRLRKALVLSSSQVGWPIDVVRCALTFDPTYVRELPQETLAAMDGLNHTNAFCTEFVSNLIKDPVASWRMNFQFSPSAVFLPPECGDTAIPQDKWKPIRKSVVEGDLGLIAEKLCEAIDRHRDDISFLSDALHNMVLLGVDLKRRELIDIVLKRLDSETMNRKLKGRSRFQLYTTFALGNAFLGELENATDFLRRLPEDDKRNDQLLGFAASILSVKGNLKDAAKLFFLTFKIRKTPLVWPLKALVELDSELRGHLEALVGGIKLPDFLDSALASKIQETIVSQNPDWSSEDNLVSSLSRIRHKEDEVDRREGEISKGRVDGQKLDLAKEKLSPEVRVLGDSLRQIMVAEQALEAAQENRNWALVRGLASQLDDLWKNAGTELRKMIDDPEIGEKCQKTTSIATILEGGKDPSALEEAIVLLNSYCLHMIEKRKQELDVQKAAFRLRLENVKLDDLWPKEEISLQEFEELKRELCSELERRERIRDIEKGLVGPSTLGTLFPDKTEQMAIIRGVFDKAARGAIPFQKTFIEIARDVDWDKATAPGILHNVLSILNRGFENGKIDEEYMTQVVIPFILKTSSTVNCPALQLVLEHPILADSFNDLLCRKSDGGMCDVVRSLVSDRAEELVRRLVEWAVDFKKQRSAIEFLLKWVEFGKETSPREKIHMFSFWLDSRLTGDREVDIPCLKKIRDALVADNRILEAALLVSAVWRAMRDVEILYGFESPLYNLLVQLLEAGDHSPDIAYKVLENPGWLIRQKGGVILFLYLCHAGGFTHLVQQARYQYFGEFESARAGYPVLVDEFFLDARFHSEPTRISMLEPQEVDIIRATQSIEQLEHRLLRKSCYKAWVPATDYQRIFNKKIVRMKKRIVHCKEGDLADLKEELESMEPDAIVESADRELGHKAIGSARLRMEKYLAGQLSRLRDLFALKEKVGDTNLETCLRVANKPILQRLRNEASDLKNVPFEMRQVYKRIIGSLK